MRKTIFFLLLAISASFAYDACDGKEVKKFLVNTNSLFQEQKAYIGLLCENNTMIVGTDLKRSQKMSKKEAAYSRADGSLDKIAADSICPGLDAFQDLGLNRKANLYTFLATMSLFI